MFQWFSFYGTLESIAMSQKNWSVKKMSFANVSNDFNISAPSTTSIQFDHSKEQMAENFSTKKQS